ncbi:helix-turn-helix domain-containing protein [Virgisporangium ochraceum]
MRDIAAGLGRSYGFVHTLLGEAGVPMRSRGGKRRQRRSP